VLDLVRASKARVVLVDVWATWCVPCREEFPDVMRLRATYRDRGLEVILVSADFHESIPDAKAFLAERGVDFPTYLKSGNDQEFIDQLDPAWGGALPANFVFEAGGLRRQSLFGKSSYETLERAVLGVLDHDTKR
jgi:thiol-disulfide isomerase/thioredoxin